MSKFLPQVRSQRGFTLVETCVTLGICATLLGQALPSLHNFHAQQRLKVEAQTVAEDLRWSRSEALLQGNSIYLSFGHKGDNQCYVIHTGAPGDCVCSGEQRTECAQQAVALRTHWVPAGSSLVVRTNAKTLNFQPRQGLVSSTASLEVGDGQGRTIRHVVAITGRVRSCAVGESLPGLKGCA